MQTVSSLMRSSHSTLMSVFINTVNILHTGTVLQLHADSVYFTLEQDAEDWARLQAEKNPTLASLQLKVYSVALDP